MPWLTNLYNVFIELELLRYESWILWDLIYASWPHLREYPVGFGVRFAQTMKKFRKERSPLLRPCCVTRLLYGAFPVLCCKNLDSSYYIPTWPDAAEAPQPEHILGIHVSPIKGFSDLWDDAKMDEVIRYLVGSYSLNLPECWHGCLPEYCL